MNACRKARIITEKIYREEWKDWEMEEFSEKDLAEKRSGEHALRAVRGIAGARKGS